MKVAALYYDGLTSRSTPVELEFFRDGNLRVLGADVDLACSLAEVTISEAVGRIPRHIELPDGSRCEVGDHAALGTILRQLRLVDGGRSWIHALESRWHFVALAVVLALGFAWGMLKHGIPYLAEQAASAIPTGVDRVLGRGTLKILDESVFGESTLDASTRTRLQERFRAIAARLEGGEAFRLVFRAGGKIGANALALPSGTIVVTDELVELSQDDNEVIAILAHELGHLVNRHSVRMVMQDSAVLLMLTAITGDAYSTADLASSLPLYLVHTGYSRNFETEADDYAYDYMVVNGIPTRSFASIMKRISNEGESSLGGKYLSTHPGTDERIERFLGTP